jgi:hypothetical protein
MAATVSEGRLECEAWIDESDREHHVVENALDSDFA